MPSFQDSIVLFILALVLFGPKRLPKLARELGKWVGEFRRASNEFKMQMEEEMRVIDRQERDDKIAQIEAAAPVSTIESESIADPEHPHLEAFDATSTTGFGEEVPAENKIEPLPIASSGDLSMMPHDTGLPVAREPQIASEHVSPDPLGGLLEAIPAVDDPASATSATAEDTEAATHG